MTDGPIQHLLATQVFLSWAHAMALQHIHWVEPFMEQHEQKNGLQAWRLPFCQNRIDGVGVSSTSYNLHKHTHSIRPGCCLKYLSLACPTSSIPEAFENADLQFSKME